MATGIISPANPNKQNAGNLPKNIDFFMVLCGIILYFVAKCRQASKSLNRFVQSGETGVSAERKIECAT